MKDKTIFYIKYLSFIIAFLGFLSLLLNPRTQYFNSNHEVIYDCGRILMLSGVLICLIIIAVSGYFTQTEKYNLKNIFTLSCLIYLVIMIYVIHRFFHIFWFEHTVDFIIFVLHVLPVPFIINDIVKPEYIKTKTFIFTGLFLVITTTLYFRYFYISYEDYWNGIAIIVIHYLIRDWLFLTGTLLILVSLLSIKTHER
ncbi:hypothetical protein AR687_14270 [Flavobacteriaceae bacterium CRH]|nr:hypothetical protein AR687_14270 [Flavobacteriaceae bacterium CRH]